MSFKVGQKVVNHIPFLGVGEITRRKIPGAVMPALYKTYTVTGFSDIGGLYLAEIPPYFNEFGNRMGFVPKKFTPLDQFLESISIKALLEEPVTI